LYSIGADKYCFEDHQTVLHTQKVVEDFFLSQFMLSICSYPCVVLLIMNKIFNMVLVKNVARKSGMEYIFPKPLWPMHSE